MVVIRETIHGGQGRTPAIVVRRGDESWWSGEETSHDGQRRRPVMSLCMVVREETSHGDQGRRPVLVVWRDHSQNDLVIIINLGGSI